MARWCYGVSAISTLQVLHQTQAAKDEEFTRMEADNFVLVFKMRRDKGQKRIHLL
jgi:hypothetical protein